MNAAFGRYELVRKLGVGGMGEVFLARPRAAEGVTPLPAAERVIKRLLPHLTANPRFLRQFLDEAKVAARLNHRNIVRLLELGEVEGEWFVGMEHVDGKDLREVMRRAQEKQRKVPLALAVRIAAEVAAALDYAHRATDPSGAPLRIVHRDVSPHNILVSFQGEVKLCDFGVAKAVNRLTETVPGMLKGKFPYMAPEQAFGKRVDARTDVFALGVVLWEMLVGRHLFRQKSDAATVKAVRACVVPAPSAEVPEVPRALDRIVLKALAADPKERFADATALRHALEDFLVARELTASRVELGGFLLELFPDRDAPLSDDLERLLGSESASIVSAGGKSLDTQALRRRFVDVSQEPTEAEGPAASAASAASDEEPTAIDDPGPDAPPSLAERLPARSTNLTPAPTRFVGRVAELAELNQRLRQKGRVHTLVGPGGSGKTRLACELASQQVGLFARGGVWWVDLTDAVDAEGLLSAVARVLAVPLPPGQTPAEAIGHLGPAISARGDLLLLLDNVEQILGAASQAVAAWSKAAPRARFVITSREALRLPKEQVFEVPPLGLPAGPDDVATSEAAMLFLDRAQLARPTYHPLVEDESAIEQIVRRLDGLPLAIELAAARMASATPAQVLARLTRRLEVEGGRGRQSTLRATIAWSWSLLQSYEQAALAQCALFRGGFTAEAAADVIDLSAFPEAPEAFACVKSLKAKSLVHSYLASGHDAAPRFALYESIRSFAREQLEAMRELVPARERHAWYFIALGSHYAAGAESSARLLDALALERENLNAIHRRALKAPREDARWRWQALSAMLALDPLVSARGPFVDQLRRLDRALELAQDAEPLLLARGYEARGRARQARSMLPEAVRDFRRVLRLSKLRGALELEGKAELGLAAAYRVLGKLSLARKHLDRALHLFRQVKDRRLEGRALGQQAMIEQEKGLAAEALATYLSALEIHREVKDRRSEGIVLSNLGVLQQQQGLLGHARSHYEEALAIHRELGNRRSEGVALLNLGDLHRDLEQPPLAAAFYERALAIHREVGNQRLEAIALLGLGTLAQARGHREDAAARYQRAIPLLRKVDDRRYHALATAALAAVDAMSGRFVRADAALARAEQALPAAEDAPFLEAVRLYRAHLELALGRKEAAGGHARDARRLQKKALARMRLAEAPSPADRVHPGGGPSAVDRSEHARTALRSLRAALEAG